MERTHYFILAAAMIGMVVGLGASETLPDSSTQQQTEPDYFVTHGVLHGNVYEYGFNANTDIEHSMRIRTLGYPERIRENFVNTNATMADVWYFEMDKLLEEEPDTKILPYQVNAREELFGFYVENGSEIDSPEDLDNKTVMLPTLPSRLTETSVMILEEEYGVDVKIADKNHYGVRDPQAPERVLNQNGKVDAVVVTGTKRLGSNHSMKPVFYPYKEMERKFGDSALPTFFVSKGDSESIRKSLEMMEDIQLASRRSVNQSEQFMEVFQICNEFMVEKEGERQIEPMTEGAEQQLQYLMNLSYKYNITDHKQDLSKYMYQGK